MASISYVYNLFTLPENAYLKVEDEMQMQFLVHSQPNIESGIISWLKEQKVESMDKSTEGSDYHREAGNRLFRANKKQNAIAASLCYTNAIFAAPDGSKALALAHANRAASIAELGFYKEAYEDCVCAVDNGYPKENMDKLITRQAFCANKLEDYDNLQACVEKLRTMTLTKPFEKQKATFEEELTRLRSDSKTETVTKESNLRQVILFHPKKGRYLTASQDIEQGEKVLTEKAFALVPLDGMRICRNCAAQNIIPFTCNICTKVFYCSLKCKNEQEMVHKYECYAYKYGFVNSIGILHLAMDAFLKGFPPLIESLKSCTNEAEIWERIQEISKSGDQGYAEVLALVTNFNSRELSSPEMFGSHCTGAALIALYLMEFTTFFDLFQGSNCTKPEWTRLISAVLLRHVFQMINNASTSATLYLATESDKFQQLCDVWEKCRHLKKGQLHSFCYHRETYAGIFPHLSVCNHSCEPSFRQKFDGDSVTVYARQQVKKASEIFNSYVPDCRNQSKTKRKESLKETFNFDCDCKHCSDDYNDDAYLHLYRYQCQNASCKAVFVPQIDDQEWWYHEGEELSFLTCTKCGDKLDMDWYWEFSELAHGLDEISLLIDVLQYAKTVLVGHSGLRAHMCEQTAITFFLSLKDGAQLDNWIITAVGEAVKYWLDVIEYNNDVKSSTYIAKATYALDLMALGKYFNFDCNKIRLSMDMLSTEMRTVFENYINDYIGEEFYARCHS